MKDYFLRDGEKQNSSKSRDNLDQNTSVEPLFWLRFRDEDCNQYTRESKEFGHE